MLSVLLSTGLAQIQSPCCFLYCPPAGTWTVQHDGRGYIQLTPSDQRDVPCHMHQDQDIKTEKEGRRGRCSKWWCLSSPVIITQWEMENKFLVLLACPAFALPIKLLLSQPTGFPTFQVSLPSHWWGSEQMAVWCLFACWGWATTPHHLSNSAWGSSYWTQADKVKLTIIRN